MNVLIGLAGILCAVIGLAVVISMGDYDERVLAAIVFGLGIAGGFLMGLSFIVGG